MFSQDLKVRENSRESLDYSQRNLLVVGNFKSSKGLFTLLRDPNLEYFMRLCCFFFELPDFRNYDIVQTNLNPRKRITQKTEESFPCVEVQSRLAAVHVWHQLSQHLLIDYLKTPKRFVNQNFFIVFPKRRKLWISFSKETFFQLYMYGGHLISRRGN